MDQLPEWVRALLIGGALSAVLGYYVARKSARKKPVQGGVLPNVLHYLASVAIVSPGIVLLIGTFAFKLPFIQSATLCFGGLGLGFVLLMLMAVFQRGAPDNTPAA